MSPEKKKREKEKIPNIILPGEDGGMAVHISY